MNETELAEYARKKGLYVEQIKAWKDACMNANGGIAKEASRLNRELKDSEKERRKLEKELHRKEKALAELSQKAERCGANAVVGIKLDYETVGASGSMLMVVASGTAVVI